MERGCSFRLKGKVDGVEGSELLQLEVDMVQMVQLLSVLPQVEVAEEAARNPTDRHLKQRWT